MVEFGKYIREKRLAMRLNLRAFCLTYEEDPSNWSKMERGLLQAPADQQRLESIARKLNLSKSEAQEMMDLAAADKGRIPPDIMNDAQLVPHLPVVFRALRDGEDIPERLNRLADLIREEMRNK